MSSITPGFSDILNEKKDEETPKVKCHKCGRFTESTAHQMLTADMKTIKCSKCVFQEIRKHNPIKLKIKK